MFRKTRKKIVLSVMAALILFLTATLAVIYGSSYLSIKKQNSEMLERYVELYSLDALPGEQPPDIPSEPAGDTLPPDVPPEPAGDTPPDILPEPAGDTPPHPDGALYRLSSFYSVAFSGEHEVLAADMGRNGLYQETEIIAFADKILNEKKSSGMLHNLMYRVDRREDYTLVAFMDTTLTDDSMGRILLNTLIAGAAAACVLLIAAVFLARRIVKPLEENDRKQKQFISDAGHELKTPISVISANSELLSRQIGENEWLSNIQYENERMGNLVRELLELSRAENRDPLQEPVDLSKLAVREVLPFEGIAYEHGLSIRSRISDKVLVYGNPHQLGQLISILVDNAISHNKGEKTIEIELKKEHRNAVLLVTNSGEKIPEGVRGHLFDRFYRVDESRREGEGHYGLGLPIAKAIVEAHRGKIRVDGTDGRIIFSVSLPLGK